MTFPESLPSADELSSPDPGLTAALGGLFAELGYSQREFSKRVPMDHSGVSRYLNGSRIPPAFFIEALLNQVEAARGVQVSEDERNRIRGLHEQAFEVNGAWGALAQMERRNRHDAERRAQQAETRAQALESFHLARRWGPNWCTFVEDRQKHAWQPPQINRLDIVSARVIGCLADPTSAQAHRTTGVVVAPLQSGKTTVGVGIVARALDAGFRLVIVFHGMHNQLRSQTQHRLEAGLVGRGTRDLTQEDRSHLQFMTSTETDYVQTPLPRLMFEKEDPNLPLFDPVNLHSATPRVAVMKQNMVVLTRLLTDLRSAEAELSEVPALLVDLEPPRRSAKQAGVGQLLDAVVELLPRAQLIRFEELPPLPEADHTSLWRGTPDFAVLAYPRACP
ncbi:hypothetical protein [Kitasatospora sp. NPDC057223]|uniref:helix-turn-helix domain-containing protein n=1 Tax=Kitasatospora sp. NPDC057223 TaxID=3346055 RepID=UPI003640979E